MNDDEIRATLLALPDAKREALLNDLDAAGFDFLIGLHADATAIDAPIVAFFGADGVLDRDDPERIMRPSEAHEFLGIGRSTLYLWIEKQRIPRPLRLSHKVSGWPRRVLIEARDSLRHDAPKKARRA